MGPREGRPSRRSLETPAMNIEFCHNEDVFELHVMVAYIYIYYERYIIYYKYIMIIYKHIILLHRLRQFFLFCHCTSSKLITSNGLMADVQIKPESRWINFYHKTILVKICFCQTADFHPELIELGD